MLDFLLAFSPAIFLVLILVVLIGLLFKLFPQNKKPIVK